MDIKKYCYDGSKQFTINKVSRSETSLCKKKAEALEKIKKNEKEIVELQEKLYAEKKEGVIFLFQAMDAAGKDGTINATLSCLSTHGVYEAAFKSPSSVEQGHDYLWRVHKECPAKGEIAIFNRSHYEEVLIYTVKSLFKSQARADRLEEKDLMPNRYKDINNFESYLYNNSIRVVKIFLNVSKEEQAKRFLSRIEELEKNWKCSESDYSERQYWDAYQEAFENAINETSTKIAPWYVVPADHKWYMRLVVSEIILATLKKMDPHYPEVSEDRKNTFLEIKAKLEEEIK